MKAKSFCDTSAQTCECTSYTNAPGTKSEGCQKRRAPKLREGSYQFVSRKSPQFSIFLLPGTPKFAPGAKHARGAPQIFCFFTEPNFFELNFVFISIFFCLNRTYCEKQQHQKQYAIVFGSLMNVRKSIDRIMMR